MSNDAGSSPTPPSTVRVGKLDTMPRVREELGRVYRDARRQAGRKLTPSDASRLAFVLQKIGETLIAEDVVKGINERLEAIERRGGQT